MLLKLSIICYINQPTGASSYGRMYSVINQCPAIIHNLTQIVCRPYNAVSRLGITAKQEDGIFPICGGWMEWVLQEVLQWLVWKVWCSWLPAALAGMTLQETLTRPVPGARWWLYPNCTAFSKLNRFSNCTPFFKIRSSGARKCSGIAFSHGYNTVVQMLLFLKILLLVLGLNVMFLGWIFSTQEQSGDDRQTSECTVSWGLRTGPCSLQCKNISIQASF